MDPRNKRGEEEEIITNDKVRSEFNNILPVKDFIGRCTLRFPGRSSEPMIDRYRKNAQCMDTNIKEKWCAAKNIEAQIQGNNPSCLT